MDVLYICKCAHTRAGYFLECFLLRFFLYYCKALLGLSPELVDVEKCEIARSHNVRLIEKVKVLQLIREFNKSATQHTKFL